MSWVITKISAKDFGSFRAFSYSFEQLLYLVRGTNWDVEAGVQHVSNGSGKTSFIDVIPVALFGVSIANRKLYSCIRKGAPYFSTSVWLRKGDDELYVERRVNADKVPSSLVVLRNGVRPNITSKTNDSRAVDIAEGQGYIYGALGLSKEQVLSYFCIGSNSYTPFPLLGEQARVDAINNISGAMLVDQVIDMYKEEARTHGQNKEVEEHRLLATEQTIVGLEQQLKEDESNFVQLQQDEIKKLNAKREALKVRRRKLAKEREEHTDRGKTLKEEKEGYLDKLKSTEVRLNELRIIQQEVKQLATFIGGAVACPACGTNFVGGSGRIVEEVAKEKKEKSVILRNANITAITQSRDSASKGVVLCDKELLNHAASAGRMQEELRLLERDIQEAADKKQQVSSREDPFKKQKEHIKKRKAEMVTLLRTIASSSRAELLATKRGNVIGMFKRYLCNRVLVHVGSSVNRVLRNLSSPFSVKIEMFKELRSKTLRHSINPVIFRNGIDRIDYGYLSRGEQGVINMSFDLALRNVINDYSEAGLAFYCNDEKLSVIDEAGITAITTSFDGSKGSCNEGLMLLCTHSAPTTKTKSEIKIEKREAVSVVGDVSDG